MAAGSIIIDLLLRTGSFSTDSDRAAKKLAELQKVAKQAGVAIGTAIVTGFTAASVAIKSSIDRMDEMSKAAQRANLPTEDFSRLAYAGDLADVSVQSLEKSFGKLAKAQSDAQGGSKAQAEAFERLGIAFENADGSLRRSYDVFLDFADAFQKYKGSPEIVALGMQIFGRSFQDMIPLLKDGAQGIRNAADESDRFHATISDKAGKAAEEFNDNLTRLKTAAKGVANVVAEDLLPDLVSLSEQFVDGAGKGDRLKQAGDDIADTFRVLAIAAQLVWGGLESISDVMRAEVSLWISFANAALAVKDALTFDFKGAAAHLRAAGQEAQEAKARLTGIPDNFNVGDGGSSSGKRKVYFAGIDPDPEGLFKNPPKPPPPPPAPDEPKTGGRKGAAGLSEEQRAAQRLQDAYDSLIASQKEQIALFGQTTEAAKARYDTEFGDLKNLSQAQKDAVIQNAEHLDQLKLEDELSKAAADAIKEQTEAEKRHNDQVNDQISDMQFELSLLSMTNDERAKAIALRYAEVDAMSEQGKKIADLAVATEEARTKAQYYDQVQSSLSDAMFDFVSGAKSAKDALGAFADALFEASLRALTDKWSENLTNMFKGFGSSGASGGSASSGGGFWSGIISLFSSFGGGKAVGGPVNSSQAYLVGEQGPEMFVPSTAGSIIPAGATAAAMSGGGAFYQNNTFLLPARIDNRSQMQVSQAAGTAAATAIRRNG